MNYNEFLLANIMLNKSLECKDIGLDDLFIKSKEWYKSFAISEYDNSNTNLYQCLEAFVDEMNDKYKVEL